MKKFWRKIFPKKKRRKAVVVESGERLAPGAMLDADVLITPNEITDRHGTGVILQRIFRNSPNILSIRTSNLFGEQSFGHASICMDFKRLTRDQSFIRMRYALNGATVKRILCIPYHADDVLGAIILSEMFSAPICMFVMDDNNLFSHGIPDELMREGLEKAKLRLAISPEMREAYEAKYGFKFFLFPPLVSPEAVCSHPPVPESEFVRAGTGVIIGSIWSKQWLTLLRQTLRASELQVHWFGNTRAKWLDVTPGELAADGIIDCDFIPEHELTERLKSYPFALIPTGTLDQRTDRPEIARLSLPTRMVYLLAGLNMPLLVVGSPRTAAAQFALRMGVGRVVDYDGAALREAVQSLCEPDTQLQLRTAAAVHAPCFSAKGTAEWIWSSLDAGRAIDSRFEQLAPGACQESLPLLAGVGLPNA